MIVNLNLFFGFFAFKTLFHISLYHKNQILSNIF